MPASAKNLAVAAAVELIAAYIRPDGDIQILTQPTAAPTASVARLIGPGLLVAAAGIGAGDIVSSTMAGAGHGLKLLWVVALAAWLKGFLNEGIARWQLATDTTAIEGWSLHLPLWVRVYVAFYLVIWTVSVSAALTSACGLGIATPPTARYPGPGGLWPTRSSVDVALSEQFPDTTRQRRAEELRVDQCSAGARADPVCPRRGVRSRAAAELDLRWRKPH